MGRARNTAGADAPFATLMGRARGRSDINSLESLEPTPVAVHAVCHYHQRLQAGDWGPALTLLAAAGPRARTAPLLADLAAEISRTLTVRAFAAAQPLIRDWWVATGLKDEVTTQIVVEENGRGLAHLWMRGPDYPLPPRKLKVETACGRKLPFERLRRGRRGEWLELEREHSVCLECQKEAWHYPETQEATDYRVLDEVVERSLIDSFALSPVLDGLLTTLADIGLQTQEGLQTQAAEIVEAQLMEYASESAVAGGEDLIKRVLGPDYNWYRRHLPDKNARLADFFDASDWKELLIIHDNNSRAERSLGWKPASGVGALRNEMRSRLSTQLNIEDF